MVNFSSGPGFAGAENMMIFIDGGYLRRNMKSLFGNDAIDYQILADYLRDNGRLDSRFAAHVIRNYYYDGIASVKDVDSFNQNTEADIKIIQAAIDLLSDKEQQQEEYVRGIKNLDLFDVRLGRHVLSPIGGIVNKKNWNWRQKGVDSLIAIDMITKAFEGQYNTAILLAGDADFVEIVNSVKNLGMNVVGAFFPGHVAQELEYSLDKKIVLTKGDLVNQNIIRENQS